VLDPATDETTHARKLVWASLDLLQLASKRKAIADCSSNLVMRLLTRKGYLIEEQGMTPSSPPCNRTYIFINRCLTIIGTERTHSTLKHHPLHFIQAHLITRSVIELGRPGGLMRRHPLGLFETPAVV
jgi:hypothetical protein